MGTISIREHIKWGSDPPSEPTSTMVLTSPRRYFVDIRILKEALEPQGNTTSASPRDALARDHIDWAIGGTSVSTRTTRTTAAAEGKEDDEEEEVSHSVFHHWVDSRTSEPEAVVDEGDMSPGPLEGTTLETGRMVNPATGEDTAYEELWRDDDDVAPPRPAAPRCTVLRLHDDPARVRGLFVQLGPHAQGVLRAGDIFTAERWRWDTASASWARVFKAGDGEAPSLAALVDGAGRQHDEGDTIETAGGVWTVIETSR